METIHLKINSNVYDHVMWLLKQFDSKDVEIVSEQFLKNKLELDESLRLIESGEMKFYSLEEIEKDTDDLLSKYED